MEQFDVAVIGGGPGGYTAAICCAQRGKRVVLFEKDQLGGTCLNRGCIPTKALLHTADTLERIRHAKSVGVKAQAELDFSAAMKRKDRVVQRSRMGIEKLLEANGVVRVLADARLEGDVVVAGEEAYRAEDIVLATGSAPMLPPIDGIEHAMTSDEILRLPTLPKSIVIIGGGVIGVEFCQLFESFGVQVTLIEALDGLLCNFDPEIGQQVGKLFRTRGVRVHTGATVEAIQKTPDGVCVRFVKDQNQTCVEAELCLCAVGRKAVLPRGVVGVEMERGKVVIDDGLRTSVPHIYAIGDVTARSNLAHTAMAQARVLAQVIAGQEASMEYAYIPQCVYITPEIASVGVDEAGAERMDPDYQTAVFSMAANGKAGASEEREGFVKLISRKDGTLIGAQLFCAHATEMISLLGVMIRHGMTARQVADSVFAHPSLSEAIWEDALCLNGEGLHSGPPPTQGEKRK